MEITRRVGIEEVWESTGATDSTRTPEGTIEVNIAIRQSTLWFLSPLWPVEGGGRAEDCKLTGGGCDDCKPDDLGLCDKLSLRASGCIAKTSRND